ncbi:uncharacterized protein TNCV_482651 [Trichonephila clavipes]|uniref:Uncharacterized protein n=1 Tax=Trichonephila clavipes TaxID=2585209 RepID=A0A8X6SE91_TRICX|nr:uncharacterized protein TNCV_482651 [Trichonephila clavipes]
MGTPTGTQNAVADVLSRNPLESTARSQSNRTERVNRDLVQMIASYVNNNHETWDQFLREFTYEIRTTVNAITGKTTVELFLGRKLITPFQKFVMVSYGTEFAVGDIEKLFDETRRNSKAKHEKWIKSDYIIKRESNENGIIVGNSDSSSSRYHSSSLEGVPPRSNWSQSSKNSGSGEKREVKGKVTGCKKDHGKGRTNVTNRRRPLEGSSKEDLIQGNRKLKKSRNEKIVRREEAARLEQDTCRYNLRPRRTDRAEFRPSSEQINDQRGPVWSRGRRDQQYRTYNKKQGSKQQSTSQSHQERKRGQSNCQNSRRAPQQQCQKIGRKSTSGRSESSEVLIGDINNRTHKADPRINHVFLLGGGCGGSFIAISINILLEFLWGRNGNSFQPAPEEERGYVN